MADGQNRAEGVGDVLSGNRRSRAVYWLEHRCLSRKDVAAGGHAQAALQCGGEIGDDVTEHVVGDDYVELRGSRTICMQSASTYMCSAVICGYSRLTSLNTRCHRPWA